MNAILIQEAEVSEVSDPSACWDRGLSLNRTASAKFRRRAADIRDEGQGSARSTNAAI